MYFSFHGTFLFQSEQISKYMYTVYEYSVVPNSNIYFAFYRSAKLLLLSDKLLISRENICSARDEREEEHRK